MSQQIDLYTTAGCHLCEEVEAMYAFIAKNAPSVTDAYRLVKVEIINDPGLLASYGEKIPVLILKEKANTTGELSWPFSIEELYVWLTDNH